jgi:hypothetical protein
VSKPTGPYIVAPLYDWALFLLPPQIALWLGVMISGSDFSNASFNLFGIETTAAELGIGVLIHAHLFAVVFRSHGNRDIYKLYRMRFVAVPLLLYAAIVSSVWFAVSATVLATFWDVWHSGAQTFGFGRIYDRNAGVTDDKARRLDYWLNQLLYAGPILAGATMIDHVDSFESFEAVGSAFFTSIPAYAEGNQRYMAWAVIGGGTLFLAYYLFAQIRLHRQGHSASPLKWFLFVSTGGCSIYSWGFNSWGEAFFIMNLFHAVQYLALVWASEKKRMAALMRVSRFRSAKALTFIGFVAVVSAYGFFAQAISGKVTLLWSMTLVVSLMHFWYDGFVWSVRKKQV